ncbi:acyl-coenzyme A thioesterase 1-like [Colius striatus]|uniref:acyl-coenzyme A thioesterase 1-like n=1 Tax=Colius striatus TaxID=57412 RepID=UPI002B1D77E7|nr:acyl-coenzyme A thioesterase 1-like [Colius striatus]XP_061854276.1 acyl-coenzyme A thioesterase 1-like [Colius striatus]
MWAVAALSLRRAGSRGRHKRPPWPGPAAPQPRGPAPARRLSSMAAAVLLSPAARSLFDEPLAIAVQGLAPRQRVTLRASLRDETNELFEARARYQAGSDGELHLGRCPALPGGSFSGLEPMGLLWALQPQRPFRRLVKRDVQNGLLLQLEVFEGHGEPPGRLLAQAQHQRVFLRDGVRRVPVREGRIRATLFLPPGNGPFPGIIDLYGIGGGLPEYRACLLANYGFAVLALAYYNYEDLPKESKEFHLEYFEEAVNYMLQHSQVKGPGIGLLGFSKGGDLCISMASFLKGITATALINASVANVGAALHYKDITIPPLGSDMKRIKVSESGIADIVDVLNNPLEGPDRQSFIPLERAECRFLFIVGQDDHNWKSEFFAAEGSKRLQAHGKEKPEIVCYPGAGHYIEPPFFPMCAASMHLLVGKPVVWGGEPKAHSEAQVDAWQQIQAFFHKHLRGESPGTSSKL